MRLDFECLQRLIERVLNSDVQLFADLAFTESEPDKVDNFAEVFGDKELFYVGCGLNDVTIGDLHDDDSIHERLTGGRKGRGMFSKA